MSSLNDFSEMPKLTARQQQILELIQSAIARTGAPPTRAEIANELGFKSANAAEEHLDRKSTRLNSSHLKLSRMPSSA